MARYQITSAPQVAQKPGLMNLAKNFAMQKGMNAAASGMGGPQGAFAMEAFKALQPALGFNEGGQAPESNWDKLMRQWAEFKQASAESEIPERMARIKEGLATRGGQQQVQRALLPLAAQAFRNMGGPIGGGQTKEALKEARSLGALTQAEYLKAMAHAGYKNDGGKITKGPLASHAYKSKDGESWEMKYHDPNKPAAGGGSKEK